MRPALFLSESEITENFIIIHIKKDFLCGRENTGLWHTLELSNECQITVFSKKLHILNVLIKYRISKRKAGGCVWEKKDMVKMANMWMANDKKVC